MADKMEQFTTPKATFVGYPKIAEPDFKFKDAGEFSLKLRLANDNPKTQEFIQRIDKMGEETLVRLREEAVKKAKTPAEGKAKAKAWEIKNCPYKAETDEEGNETGYTLFSMKATHSGVNKKTKKSWKRSVPLFDAKGKPLPKNADKLTYAVKVWGGSEGYATFGMAGYGQTTSVGAGVKLYLEAVKITKLVSGGSRDQDAYGFGDTDEEDGFDARDAETDATNSAASTGGDDQPTGESDASDVPETSDF